MIAAVSTWTDSSPSRGPTSRSGSASERTVRRARASGLFGLVAAFAVSLPSCTPAHRTVDPPSALAAPYIAILGTAQDGGLPHAACSCAHCESARNSPSQRRAVASLAIVVPATGHRYLVDASPDLREQLERLPAAGERPRGRVDRAPVDGVLLTHAHVGHYLGLAFFGFEAVHTHALPIYATPRMTQFLRENAPWARLVAREEISLHETPPGVAYELEPGVRVTPFLVPHRDEDSDTVGYRITGPTRTIVYVPDTDQWATWSPSLPEVLADCDVALLDGTFFSAAELPGREITSIGHPLVTTTLELLQESVRGGRLKVFFTHLNHSNPLVDSGSPERNRVQDRGFGVAAEGQRIDL